MIDQNELVRVLSGDGTYTFAYLDGHGDEPTPAEHSRRHALLDELRKRGAPEPDVQAVDETVATDAGIPSPSVLYLLVRDGRVELAERFVGERLGPEQIGYQRVPPVLPLLRHAAADIRYVLVEAGREGAHLRVETWGRAGTDEAAEVQGRTDSLPKVQAGGWSHRRYQMHSEEIWKQTQSEVDDALEQLVLEHRPSFVVIAGDVRARQLLEDQLGPSTRALLVDVDAHTKAEGADDEALDEAISAAVDQHLRRDIDEALDRAAVDNGANGARGVADVVAALRQAQVDTLVLNARELGVDGTLEALDAEPWVAHDVDDRLGANVIEQVSIAEGLARAAVLTGASVLVQEVDEPAEGEPMPERPEPQPVAVLRWPREASEDSA
ncbi:baeRF2 domain-containing protein [Humibacter sp.]|uniref:baeRF2 domain-containing protein n=1 Tax=Humibacter sp. TaxID=1940291 RepID=UPI003F7D7D23